MIELRPYIVEDFNAVQDAVEPFCMSGDDASLTEHGVAITATDGDVTACGGIAYTNDGWMAWMRINEKCKDNAYAWGRTIKEAFKLMLESVDAPVFTYILKGFCQGERLARAIGMKKTKETLELNGNIYFKYTVA